MAVRIFTGAPMPPGADTVIMQEDAAEEAGAVRIAGGLKPGANCRPAGEDVAAGALALPAGRRLGPAEIGLAAAIGQAELGVRPLLRVGVFSTGDELASPGQPLGPAQTYDSNRFTLLAMLGRLPVAASDLGILPDDPAATRRALAAAAASHDLLLTSGGVSTGEADHVKAAIEAEGRLVFWRLAIKPGRPAAMGMVGGVPVVGLPGNPVAAVVRLTNSVPWFAATFITDRLMSEASFCFAASPRRPSCRASRSSVAVKTNGTDRWKPMVAGTANCV
jgi:molybdopterin molybdotransferase